MLYIKKISTIPIHTNTIQHGLSVFLKLSNRVQNNNYSPINV